MAPRFATCLALLLLAFVPAEAVPARTEDAKPEAGKPVALVMPLAYGTHLPGLGTPALDLAKLIKERSAGTLVLDLKEPGEGPNAFDILDKVSDGSADAGFATASFWAAKIPAAPLFSGFPFGLDGKTYLDWFETGNGRTLYQELYDHAGFKVHVLPCAFGGAETGGWFAKEIANKKDIEGLQMRIFGLGARVLSRLGATTLLVPGKDLAKAFAKKEIEAAELYPPASDRPLGLQENVKLIYVPGWHQPETVIELIVNRERWDGLSEAQRGVIEGACRDLLRSSLEDSARLQAEALTALAEKDGVRIAAWPGEVLKALRDAWTDLAKEESERDYFFQEVLEDIEKFRNRDMRAPQPPPAAPTSPKARAPARP